MILLSKRKNKKTWHDTNECTFQKQITQTKPVSVSFRLTEPTTRSQPVAAAPAAAPDAAIEGNALAIAAAAPWKAATALAPRP